MLKYNGKLFFKNPINDEEVDFLNAWQRNLVEIYNEYCQVALKSEKESISLKLNSYSNIHFSSQQRWAIFFAMSPMIEFKKDHILIKGQHKKGNIREAVLAYKHFFFNNDGVLKQCMGANFIQSNELEGIIECTKKKYEEETKWCYLFKDNEVHSINDATIKTYEKNPHDFTLTFKEDSFHEKLLKYFPPLMEYAKLKSSLTEKNTSTQKSRIKI